MPTSMRTPAVAAKGIRAGDFLVRLAADAADVLAAQRVRFRVFHDELGESLAGAAELGRDEDRFDAHCDHLLLIDTVSNQVVGTYRMQTAERARGGAGFYCDGEFELAQLPLAIQNDAVELGRACILREHRRSIALFGLWRGIAEYLMRERKRYLFGCCSLTGVDVPLAATAAAWLLREGHQHTSVQVAVRAECAAAGPLPSVAALAAFELPPLFQTYLRYGARVCGGPALDREFGTTDFLVLLDVLELSARQRALFFPGS